ncbi:MAG: hypothetical protein P8J79_05220 [Halioglobus sp.]|nr:hypothetical protein [Halioglobus sp.]
MDNTATPEDLTKTPSPAKAGGMRLAKLALTHGLIFVVALSLFAAADSWTTITGLGIATVLCIVTGALAGIIITTLVHEWFHYLGARYSGAAYEVPQKQGLFLYNWDFTHNSVRQFLIMSVAGSVGGILALMILWTSVPADSWGRAALHGGAIASVVFAAVIEWPVIRRVRISRDPLVQMSTIDRRVLSRSFVVSSIAGVLMTLVIVA